MRALVTGANRGLGLEIVRQLLDGGARVFASARSPSAALESLRGERLSLHRLDLGDAASIAAAGDQIAALTDGLEVLINCAGITSTQPPGSPPPSGPPQPDAVLELLRINAVGALRVAQRFVPLLLRGERPRLMNVSSFRGSLTLATAGGLGYSTSKAALNMLTRKMALDLKPRGLVCVAVNPGWVATEMSVGATLSPEESVRGMLALLERLGPDDAGRFFNWDGSDCPF
jgi:NAD(P)-dependent dehydrogenase (short-subunit alcohol dehydrogenase family)